MTSTLADRMKEYEQVAQTRLARRVPVIVRVDGKAFHTLCKGMDRPFDERLIRCMWAAAEHLCQNMQGCQLAYVQSDEISLLMTDWDRYETQSWFDYRIQKMVSVAAGLATVGFHEAFVREFEGTSFVSHSPCFDARASNYPEHEVINYFVWRQLDWVRNSVHMLGRAHFSAKKLHKKHAGMVKDMLRQKEGIEWDDLAGYLKHGACIIKKIVPVQPQYGGGPGMTFNPPLQPGDRVGVSVSGEAGAKHTRVQRWRWAVDEDLPLFTEDRGYVGKHLTDVFWKEEVPSEDDAV